MRSFKDWWNSSVPSDLQQKIRKGDENNKPPYNCNILIQTDSKRLSEWVMALRPVNY